MYFKTFFGSKGLYSQRHEVLVGLHDAKLIQSAPWFVC